jgi:CheY-like chemotaxis protein
VQASGSSSPPALTNNSTSEQLITRKQQAAPIEAGPALRILLADDAADNRLVVKAYLKHTAYQLTIVENGALAVERFTREPFDLILMDIQMPVMDGYEAMKLIRQYEAHEAKPATPIIALTASAFGEDIDRCLKSGATAHVAKPVSKRVLIATIQLYALDPAFVPPPLESSAAVISH